MTMPEQLYCVTWKTSSGNHLITTDSGETADAVAVALDISGRGDIYAARITPEVREELIAKFGAPEPPVDEPLVGEAARRVRGQLRRAGAPWDRDRSHADGVADSMFSDRLADPRLGDATGHLYDE